MQTQTTQSTRLIRATMTPQANQKKDELQQMVEEYAKLATAYEADEKLFKESHKEQKARIDALEATLKAKAKELDVTSLPGEKVTLEFKGRNSRSIKPSDLFVFFKQMGQTVRFLDFVKVQLSELEKEMGAGVIEASNLVENEYNKWSGIKIKPRLSA